MPVDVAGLFRANARRLSGAWKEPEAKATSGTEASPPVCL